MPWCICSSRLRIMSITGHAVVHGSAGFQQGEVAVKGVAMLKTLFESTRKGSRRTFRPAVEALEGRLAPTLAPTALVASGGGDGTNIMSWVPVAGAVRYNIYSGPSSGQETLDPEGTGLTNPSYIDTGNPNGVPIFYQFTAVDAAGHESTRSNEIEMTPFDTMP